VYDVANGGKTYLLRTIPSQGKTKGCHPRRLRHLVGLFCNLANELTISIVSLHHQSHHPIKDNRNPPNLALIRHITCI
jgi:hypothetical protein